jgi:hypothetical protein
MTMLALLQEATGAAPSIPQDIGAVITAIFGLTTAMLAALTKSQNDRIKDKDAEIARMTSANIESVKNEREGRAKAEKREDDAIAQAQKSANIVQELTSALREAASVIKDALTETRVAAAEAKRAVELLERADRKLENHERLLTQLTYQRGIHTPQRQGE